MSIAARLVFKEIVIISPVCRLTSFVEQKGLVSSNRSFPLGFTWGRAEDWGDGKKRGDSPGSQPWTPPLLGLVFGVRGNTGV